MRNLIMFATIALFCAPFVHSQEPMSSNVRTVEPFVAAFNPQDCETMAEFVADDVAWLNIAGKDAAVEVTGKSERVASMNAYFESCQTSQSEISGTISTPGRVSAIEIASWQDKSGSRSQRKISVYEFSEGSIKRVYYLPSEN